MSGYVSLIDLCEQIKDGEEAIAGYQRHINDLKHQVEDQTGKTYEEFIAGMRRLMAPAEPNPLERKYNEERI